MQPDSRSISQEQLASELKSIYAGLTLVETKCIKTQAAAYEESTEKLSPDHWQALIALHRTLLHEHHDFLLASQHPSTSPATRRLAAKYTMPARMWKHGIYAFLELLRQGLPQTLDHMLAFIYLAYQMLALLYEVVPSFKGTWVECLGDLARYRMAIEDKDIKDREIWLRNSRSWYTLRVDGNPITGRLYHHLAILARPKVLSQLFYFARSLSSMDLFEATLSSIRTLFTPYVGMRTVSRDSGAPTSSELGIHDSFVCAQACLFHKFHPRPFTKDQAEFFAEDSPTRFAQARGYFLENLGCHIGRVTAKWKEEGAHIAAACITAWFGWEVMSVRSSPSLLQLLDLFEHPDDPNKKPPAVDVIEGLHGSHILRQFFLMKHLRRRQREANMVLPLSEEFFTDEHQVRSALAYDSTFSEARQLSLKTLAVALHRVGDKNVLPCVHIMLSFLHTLAESPCTSHLTEDTPWVALASFLNELIESEGFKKASDNLWSQPIFQQAEGYGEDRGRPLPEDWLLRGSIWTDEFFPVRWFNRHLDAENRNLELKSTAKDRVRRVLKLGYRLSLVSPSVWMSTLSLTSKACSWDIVR